MSDLFHGLSAFPITPADPEGRVDIDALGRVLRPMVAAGVNSIGLLGSTGSYAYLSRAERSRTVIAAVEHTEGQIPLIVGVGALRTSEAQALAEDAQAAGANGLLLAPVSYVPLTHDEVFAHFRAIASSTDLPLCIYNNPGTTHFQFDTALLARLGEVPNILAVKMPLPQMTDMATDLGNLRAAMPKGFVVGYSGDWGCAEGLLCGADSWFSVIAGLMPGLALQLTNAALAGDAATTGAINERLQVFWGLLRRFGGLRVAHAAANLMGLTDAQPPRPVLPLETADRLELQTVLADLGALAH